MKFSTFAIAIIAAMAASLAPSAEASCLVIKTEDGVFDACNAADGELIDNELAPVFAEGCDRRALRASVGGRDLQGQPCSILCQGFLTGTW